MHACDLMREACGRHVKHVLSTRRASVLPPRKQRLQQQKLLSNALGGPPLHPRPCCRCRHDRVKTSRCSASAAEPLSSGRPEPPLGSGRTARIQQAAVFGGALLCAVACCCWAGTSHASCHAASLSLVESPRGKHCWAGGSSGASCLGTCNSLNKPFVVWRYRSLRFGRQECLDRAGSRRAPHAVWPGPPCGMRSFWPISVPCDALL